MCQIAHVHKATNSVIVKDIDDPYLHRLLAVLVLLVGISLADGKYLLKFHGDAWLAYTLWLRFLAIFTTFWSIRWEILPGLVRAYDIYQAKLIEVCIPYDISFSRRDKAGQGSSDILLLEDSFHGWVLLADGNFHGALRLRHRGIPIDWDDISAKKLIHFEISVNSFRNFVTRGLRADEHAIR